MISALASDYRTAELSSMDRVMLDYVVKLTKTPSEVVRQDVEGLRAVGFEDRAIHDICAITAYYAFVNRIADGLGVELE
ncbi:MAG: peroxidase [Acidobacteria bacterium]|nr:MAG: peroxidase [Acidobacteriota bacterium]